MSTIIKTILIILTLVSMSFAFGDNWGGKRYGSDKFGPGDSGSFVTFNGQSVTFGGDSVTWQGN